MFHLKCITQKTEFFESTNKERNCNRNEDKANHIINPLGKLEPINCESRKQNDNKIELMAPPD